MRFLMPQPTEPAGMPLAGRKAVFFGMAKSGLAAAEFLQAHGAQTLVVDETPADKKSAELKTLEDLGVRGRAGVKDYAEFDSPDLIVVTPGVPVDHPFLEQARAHGVEVIGEIELAYRFCKAPIVAVTGTNGKGSTTTMLGGMLEAAGLRVKVAGNIGLPLVSVVGEDWQVIVAEISSFQLETIVHFHPWAAILLNITPDHLERHKTLEAYAAAKQRLFMNQQAGDLAVLDVDNEAAASVADQLPLEALRVALDGAGTSASAFLSGDELIVHLPDREPLAVCRVEDLTIQSEHMISDALCAAVVAVAAGCTPEHITEAMRAWRPVTHQMTEVAVINGVRFIDSSKATNVASAIADVSSVVGPAYVIAGGLTKDADMTPYADLLAERASGVFLIGDGRFEIAVGIANRVPVTMCDSIEDAVQAAYAEAESGATVILAPACASFDQFRNQAERGDRFAAAATALAT